MMSPKERQKLGIVRGKVSGKLYPKKDIKKYENLETKRRKRPQIVDSKTKFKDGGLIIAPKSGSAHYKSKKSSKAIAKKYFKGTF